MSAEEKMQGDSPEQPEFVETQDVEEVVQDDDRQQTNPQPDEKISGNDVKMNEDGNIEIDMSNNSIAYFDQHTDSIFTIATHPTLPLAVSGGGDNVAYLWTTHTSPTRLAGKLEGYTESVIASEFTPDGKFLVTGDMTGKILIHKATKRGQVWVPYGELQQVEEISWITMHPKEDIFAFGATDGSVWAYQIGANKEISLIFTGYSHSLDCTAGEFFDVNNNFGELKLATACEDGTIIGWNCYTSNQLFHIHTAELKGITPPWVTLSVYSNTGKIAAVGSRDSHVAIVNLETGTVVKVITALTPKDTDDVFDASIEGVSWCKSLPLLALGLVSGDVFIIDTRTWQVRKKMKCQDAITKLTFFKDTPFLLGTSMEGKVYKWDARTGSVIQSYTGHHMGVLDFAIDCADRLVTAGDDGVSLVFTI